MDDKIGFMFGAGVEQGIGMPSGGKLAVSIFGNDSREGKELFNSLISGEKCKSAKWKSSAKSLINYKQFTKDQLRSIDTSIVDKKSDVLKQFYLKFNDECITTVPDTKRDAVKKMLNQKCTESEEYKILKYLPDYRMQTDYFAVFLEDYEDKNNKNELPENYKEILSVLLSGYFIVLGNCSLSTNLFGENKSSLLTDLYSLFSIDYSKFPLFSGSVPKDIFADKNTPEPIYDIARATTARMLETIMDYQLLLHSYYDNLFYHSDPKQMPKFCKVSSLLCNITAFIESNFNKCIEKANENSFYSDINTNQNKKEFTICTSNYSPIEDIVGMKRSDIFYLNGCTDTVVDLYNLSLVSKMEASKADYPYPCVPFIFPQTTLKPFMIFDVMKIYVDAYSALAKKRCVVIVGFNFNTDDSIIISMFRKLLYEKKSAVRKMICFIHITSKFSDFKEEEAKNDMQNKLHCAHEQHDALIILPINDERMTVYNGKTQNWLKVVEEINNKEESK